MMMMVGVTCHTRRADVGLSEWKTVGINGTTGTSLHEITCKLAPSMRAEGSYDIVVQMIGWR